jgi:predicted lipid-binding transport protein (Tim44 family)
MKKLLSLFAVVLALGLTTAMPEAEAAKRMGSGKSLGMQRQATPDKPAAAPTQNAAANPGAAGAAASPSRSWMGPVAGLAAGLGLAALASHLGFGAELANFMMMALLAVVAVAVIGYFMRKKTGGPRPLVAGVDGKTQAYNQAMEDARAKPAYRVEQPAATGSMIGAGLSGTGGSAGASAGTAIPADFDAAGFERNAKVSFIRLQAANDAGDLNDLRLFTTPQMFAELKMELTDRGDAPQKYEVNNLHAKVLEVDTQPDSYSVSVRFTGFMTDTVSGEADSFDEIWNLTKSRQTDTGWLLAGIQQVE